MTRPLDSWLRRHGLAHLAQAFNRHGVDLDVLSDLSEADLTAMEVNLGDRRRLSRALEAPAEATPSEAAAEADGWARQPGERKPVTMLFADVTGSTALTEGLDPEDAHEVLYGAVERLCETVERNRGTVCRFMGDGVMAMFGAPASYEDHAVWACRAGLMMLEAIERYGRESPGGRARELEVRVGLHSGEVVVLRVGDGPQASYDASGPTVPLAARMEQSAEPGTVRMTASTFRLVAARFEGEPLPAATVKGFSEPVEMVRLIAERPTDTVPAGGPFVGREAELAQLRACLEACRRGGAGRVIYLRGEPCIGKSRLVARLSEEAGARGFAVHRTLVLDFGTARGRDPIRLLARDLVGVGPDAAEDVRREVVARAVASGLAAPEHEPHLCDLLDLSPPPERRAAYEAMDATVRARERGRVLAALVASLARERPRLVVIEDLHWAPKPVRDYLRAIAQRLVSCPAVLAITSRADGDHLQAGWQSELDGLPLTVLGLAPLSPVEARDLALGIGVSEEKEIAACLERSGCNPLFLTHLLDSISEGAVTELPSSVQTSVAARVDGLEDLDKRAVRAAAVLGQRFDREALEALVGVQSYDCERLVSRGLVRPDGEAFLFSHALVREAVLASLLRADRRSLHLEAAAWFEPRDPVLRASHLDRAGDPRAVVGYLEAARAEADAMRFDYARSLVERGLELVAEDDPRGDLHALHGRLLMGVGEMQAAADAYRQAAESAPTPEARCAAWTGAAHALRNSGAYDQALRALEEAEAQAREHRLTRDLAAIHHHRGNVYFLRADATACEHEQRQAMALARSCGDPEVEALALTGLGRAAFGAGRVLSCGRLVTRAVEIARRHGLEPILYGHLHMVALGLEQELRLEDAIALLDDAADRAVTLGVPRQAVVSYHTSAKILAELGRLDEARLHATRCLEIGETVGEARYRPAAECVLAKVAAQRGDPAEAQRRLREAWSAMGPLDKPFSGGLVLGALALVVGDASARRRVIDEGRRIGAGDCVLGLNIHFYADAIQACATHGEWALAMELASELEALTRAEPMPLTDFAVRWARAGPAGRGAEPARETLTALHARALESQYRAVLPALEAALA